MYVESNALTVGKSLDEVAPHAVTTPLGSTNWERTRSWPVAPPRYVDHRRIPAAVKLETKAFCAPGNPDVVW